MMRYTVSMNRTTWHSVREFLASAHPGWWGLGHYSNMDWVRVYWLGRRIRRVVRRHPKHYASGFPVYMRLTGQQIAYIEEVAAIMAATGSPCQADTANTIIRRLQNAGAMD